MSTKLDLEKLHNAVDLVHLVEKAGTLLSHKSSRGEYRGKCPLHDGENPTAFQIYRSNDGRQRWRCWADCNTSGDVISFIMASENLDFIEAIKWLLDYANMSLDEIGFTPEAAQGYKEQRQCTDILDMAATFYTQHLWAQTGAGALNYVRGRAFTDDVIRLAGWGFSDGSKALHDYLETIGADMAIARKLGLIRKDGRDFTANADGAKLSPAGWLIYSHKLHTNAHIKEAL